MKKTEFASPILNSVSNAKWLSVLGIMMFSGASAIAQVGISNTSITPDASSVLELRSTTSGFLPPRMATTERDAISGPATGLLVYNTTTNQLNYYTGTAWQAIVTGSGISGTVGSAGSVIYSNGTQVASTGVGTAGQVLQSNGSSAPTWVTRSDRNIVTLANDVVDNSATANTIQDVTGLSFPVTAGVTYNFQALILYTAFSTGTGSRWAINGPASPTMLAYSCDYSRDAQNNTTTSAIAYDMPANSSGNSAYTAGNICTIYGIIKPSVSGTVTVRFASGKSNEAITAKAGSTLTWW